MDYSLNNPVRVNNTFNKIIAFGGTYIAGGVDLATEIEGRPGYAGRDFFPFFDGNEQAQQAAGRPLHNQGGWQRGQAR